MKNFTKYLLISFTVTVLILVSAILVFLYLINDDTALMQDSNVGKIETDEVEKALPENYTNYSDNVGGVSFTEDQITELVRKIYYLDGYINNLSVDFEDNGDIQVVGKIKDVEKLCEIYPELSYYSAVLSTIENKNITVRGSLFNNMGMADFEIISAKVGKLKIDKNILTPFLEKGVFSEFFNVEYDSVEIFNDSVIFKDGVPPILSY